MTWKYKINKKFYYIAGLVMSLPLIVGCSTNTQDDWTTTVVSLSAVTGLEDCKTHHSQRGKFSSVFRWWGVVTLKPPVWTQTSGKTKKQINLIEDGNLEKSWTRKLKGLLLTRKSLKQSSVNTGRKNNGIWV